jgi:MarR family transcriptional regulator, transcriptional regulator for hemolysin
MQATLDQDFLFLLYDVARTMRTRADQRARARGMTRAQWVILARLERQPGLTQNEMAAIVEVEPITIARLVDRLEARGLVVRKADPRDRRVWRLHLTSAAAPILREIGKYRAELHDLITAGMTPALQKALTDGLLQMKANLAAEVRVPGKGSGATAPIPDHNGGAARRERHA